MYDTLSEGKINKTNNEYQCRSRAIAHWHGRVLPVRYSHAARRAQPGGPALSHVDRRFKVPPPEIFERAITPDNPRTAPLTTLIGDFWAGVAPSRMEPRDLRRSISSSVCYTATLTARTRGRAIRCCILLACLTGPLLADSVEGFAW